MSQDQQTDNQWAELDDEEVHQDHHHTEEEQHETYNEEDVVAAAQPFGQEGEAPANRPDQEEDVEAAQPSQLEDEAPANRPDKQEDVEAAQPSQLEDEAPANRPDQEEDVEAAQPSQLEDEAPANRPDQEEDVEAAAAVADERHHHHNEYPSEETTEEHHQHPVEETPDMQEEAAAAQLPEQWAETDEGESQEQPHHHGKHAPAPDGVYGEELRQETHSTHTPQVARQQLNTIVKPRARSVKGVAHWEPTEYQPREGSDDEFEMSTCMAPVYEGGDEADKEDASMFKNGGPDCEGEIMSCFDEPNLLYRIIDPKEKTWAFYNDSLNYEMHVQFTFGRHSKLQPLENTVMSQNDEGQYVTEVVVYPTETEMFVQGSVNGFTSKLRAVPLSDEYHKARRSITEEQVASETAAIQQLTDSDNAEDVLQVCIEKGIAFVDPEFPPCQASLDTGATKPFKPFAWARPQACVPEEMVSQVRLFRSNVQPGCVNAGDLGDSWVMCAVAAVSEDPARLMGMFRHPEGKTAAQREHAVGAYRVTFNKNGWWRSVLVDSYLPVSAGKLKYAKSAVDPAEIWPAILEKAYAKLHGSYAKICSGDPLHALQDMTGFSTMRFDDSLTSEKDSIQLFDDLVRGIAAGYTVICNTPGNDPKSKDGKNAPLTAEYAEVGLLTGHAYTILDAKYIENENLRIVKVRNTWGRGLEWNGDWSDNDSKWEEYPEIADACGFQKAADGTFWMPWEAAVKYFNGGGECFSHQPAYDYRMNSVFVNGVPSAVLEVEVLSPTWFTFVISQDDKRCQENVTEYQPVMISIAEPVEGDMYKVVLNSSADGVHPTPDKWTFLQARDISLVHKLDAGKYIIVPRSLPSDAEPVPYVLGMITNKEVGSGDVSVKFKRLDASNRVFENFPKFEPELNEVEQPVQFQKRAPGDGFPLTQMGEELA